MPDALATVSSIVELLSPIAPPDALAAAFYGCFSHRSRGLIAPIDWGQSIYQPNDATRSCIHYADRLS
jgi:hypothetical protein